MINLANQPFPASAFFVGLLLGECGVALHLSFSAPSSHASSSDWKLETYILCFGLKVVNHQPFENVIV